MQIFILNFVTRIVENAFSESEEFDCIPVRLNKILENVINDVELLPELQVSFNTIISIDLVFHINILLNACVSHEYLNNICTI